MGEDVPNPGEALCDRVGKYGGELPSQRRREGEGGTLLGGTGSGSDWDIKVKNNF